MSSRNRELSQFGSFLEINNTNKNIGIATEATPYIGIGTTNPQYKLHLIGETNIDGTIYLNGTPLVDAALETWSISGSDIYRLNGNVGIGTSTFSSKLNVLGDATFSSTATASRFISTVSTGTAPLSVTSQTLVTNLNADYLRGKTPPTGSIVGDSDSQALSNKTINLTNNTLVGTTTQFNSALSDDNFVTLSGSETLTNKTLTTPIISAIRTGAGATQTVPSGTGTLLSTSSVGVITSGMISDGSITDSDISATAGIQTGKLSAFTISGVSLGSTLNSLTAGSFITYNSGTTYDGSAARTIGVSGTTANTSNTLVARDASGDFDAGTINCANLDASFSVNSLDFRINNSVFIDQTKTLVGISSVGIGTDNPISGIHIAGPDGYNLYLDSRRSDVPEKQLIFDNGTTYCYLYLNKNTNPFGESFGWLDQSLVKYGTGANRNIFFYRPPQGTLHLGEAIVVDIDNLKVGIGTTTPSEKLHVIGNISADTYTIGSGTSSTANADISIDAATTQRHSRIASFTTNRIIQISNLTLGREVKVFIKNTNGAVSPVITVQASTTTTGFSNVDMARTPGIASTSTVTLNTSGGAAHIWVANIAGNFVGGM